MGNFAVVVVGLLIGGFVFGVSYGIEFTTDKFQSEAIQRGYALFCPSDGKFSWAGECGK